MTTLLTQYRRNLSVHLSQWERFAPTARSPSVANTLREALFKIPHGHPESQSWPVGVRQAPFHPSALHPIEQLYGLHLHAITALMVSADEMVHTTLKQWFEHANIAPANIRSPLGRDVWMCAALQNVGDKKGWEHLADFLPFSPTVDNDGDNLFSYITNYSNANCQLLVDYLLENADMGHMATCAISPSVDVSPTRSQTRECNREQLRSFVLRVRMEHVVPQRATSSPLRKM